MIAAASFVRLGPEVPASPLVVAVSHAGRDYPAALAAAARLPVAQLVALEDRWADLLAEPLADGGATVFVARRARAWIDLNRDPTELDPAMLEPAPAPPPGGLGRRVRSGLGLVPRRVPGGSEIYARRIDAADVARRIAEEHAPWHAAIGAALARAHARFGAAVLIDCHSMPPLAGHEAPDVVLGDRFGRSAGGAVVNAARGVLATREVRAALNVPYAGGYAVERHGRPERGVHALQIEFSRTLYLDPALRAPGDGLPATRALLAMIAAAVVQAITPAALAAE